MAEWVPPPDPSSSSSKPPPPPPPPPPPQPPSSDQPEPSEPDHPPPPRDTYVVQVPKDQVYRVPPPENAYLVEHYRKTRKHRSSSFYCCSWILFSLTVFAFFVVLFGALFYLSVKPKTPRFIIHHVHVVHPRNDGGRPGYNVTLRTENPSLRMGVSYFKGGSAILSYHRQVIAVGRTPGFYQRQRSSGMVSLLLDGSDMVMPDEVERSLKGKKPRRDVDLAMVVNFPAKLRAGVMKSWTMNVAVRCEVAVNTLAVGTSVVKQECHAKVQP
ncbi:hypothetical protein QJS10_CPB12g01205 [Acorus calamus]|uniref:Late embryogenesis abundant protein LEA-2 subgroup domain-containing protein n=1 Tax=Acorus calamus TaxID=4465 RepID=A0AAV9DQ00_ACOCL|nr:hypothetical protein QJS10_CPB12g01205 [Acorus calamus]